MRKLAALAALMLSFPVSPASASKEWERGRPMLMDMARQGRAEEAYLNALRFGGEDGWDARFVAGYIALRRMNRPDLAIQHFVETAVLAKDAYGKATAGFWLGRALSSVGRADDAAKAYKAAAAWSHTFYGQVASARLGGVTAIATDPKAIFGATDVQEALASAEGRKIADAQARGDVAARNQALRRLSGGTYKQMGIACALAVRTGATEIAVDIARAAAKRGTALVECGWPQVSYAWHDKRAPLELVLAVSREESAFKQSAASGAGANGSMQVTDGAARDVGKKSGVAIDLQLMRASADYNVAVGSFYLGDMLKRYGFHPVVALAAYNAGPQRADDWLVKLGDPRNGTMDVVDWIEEIPFWETRGYVKKVMSSYIIYLSQKKPVAAAK